MLDKDPMTRITIKHIAEHPFVKTTILKLGEDPIRISKNKKNKLQAPMYLSQVLNKIVTKEIVGLKVQKRREFEELEK